MPDSDAARPDDPVTIDIPCKCIMHSCGSMHFQNVKMLMTHINTVHHNDARTCVFENCNQKFAPGYISRHRFRKKHIEAKNMKLGKIHLVNPLNASRGIINPDEINDETFDSDDRGDEVCVFTDGYDAFDIDNLENDDILNFFHAPQSSLEPTSSQSLVVVSIELSLLPNQQTPC